MDIMPPNLREQFDAVDSGQAQIQERDVRLLLLKYCKRLIRSTNLTDHRHIGLQIDYFAETFAEDWVVFDA
jgi:hypothetical protein